MVLLTTLCGGCKKHSNSVSGLFVSQKGLERQIQRGKHMSTLVVVVSVSVMSKRHSNSISYVLVSQKRLEKNKEKDWYMGTLVGPIPLLAI